MIVISREEAVCLFYAVPYNEENVRKYTKIIDELEDVEICFTRNPKKPKLLCTRDKETHDVVNTNNKIMLGTYSEVFFLPSMTKLILFIESKQQLKQFLDTAYLPMDPKSISYELRYLSIDDIMSEIQNYSLAFQDEPCSKFRVWCTSQKLKCLDAGVKRKHGKLGTRLSLRGIYVLKDHFKGK
ncbi:hypothetical protein BDF20DRAFT_941491 [Mycotypha africana]|uniref:uncharacterized protein n=1 Tax=Mycotypha africana TaxID=64632 RepID=UPI002301F262|nr:uncharacterized protein BDF20DRAFT_941491 [Mycotypha africana]KAI8977159.1 hypothetical protein BDF20DRAFT_941491 [Mycotypha africana]